MKSQLLFPALLLAWACAGITGCDSDSSSSRITVTPASATISEGQSIEFVASGGYEYTWSLTEYSSGAEPYGRLSSKTGSRVTYTSLRNGSGAAEVRVLTVTSTIEGADATNSSPGEWTTEAYITHVADGNDVDDDPLKVSPDSAVMSTNGVIEFTASGGTGSYSWQLDPDSHGRLSSLTGNQVTYTATNVTPTDSTVITVFSGAETDNAIVTY